MLTLSTIIDTYEATEEKESDFSLTPNYGHFDGNCDYSFNEQPFENDDQLRWC